MTAKLSTLVGIDTGGTFTDFVLVDGGNIRVHKEASTPDNPARAVLAGLQKLVGTEVVGIVHGSTVATNALLEHRGAKAVLLTTAGFEDVLEIGRQTRRAIYDIDVTKVAPLVPAERRLGIRERMGPKGEVLTALEAGEIKAIVKQVAALDVASVAICFLHSYANPTHEAQVLQALETEIDAFVTASHLVLPEFREYERCSTTVVNAYVGPVMSRYLSHLAESLDAGRVRIMQSNGGLLSLEMAQRFAVQTILSGPAGGAVGGFEMGRRSGFEQVITFDMGGTSTDVCLCPAVLSRTTEAVIGEMPIRVPVIDVHTVGAGGGSIAYRDPGGSLRVGPQSAGAVPGPICYGRGGTELTVTDANLFLGRLSPQHFLGGQQTLEIGRVQDILEQFSKDLKLTPAQTAEGILRVANATMERAIRVISLERGHDPRDFTLVCFGGAGAMHAADLARQLGIPRVLVPPAAGALSALGMLLADYVRDYSRTLLTPTAELRERDLESAFGELEARARADAVAEGHDEDAIVMERTMDVRYVGQGYELEVPAAANVDVQFHDIHNKRYGYADPKRPTEVVNVRLRAMVRVAKPQVTAHELEREDASAAQVDEAAMLFDGRESAGRIFDRDRLRPGNIVQGPGLVVEYSTTTVVPPDFRCVVDAYQSLVISHSDRTLGKG